MLSEEHPDLVAIDFSKECLQVVGDKNNDQEPLIASLDVKPEESHKEDYLYNENELQDVIVAEEADRYILIEVGDIRTDVVRSGEEVHSLLEASVHDRQLGEQDVALCRQIGI